MEVTRLEIGESHFDVVAALGRGLLWAKVTDNTWEAPKPYKEVPFTLRLA